MHFAGRRAAEERDRRAGDAPSRLRRERRKRRRIDETFSRTKTVGGMASQAASDLP